MVFQPLLSLFSGRRNAAKTKDEKNMNKENKTSGNAQLAGRSSADSAAAKTTLVDKSDMHAKEKLMTKTENEALKSQKHSLRSRKSLPRLATSSALGGSTLYEKSSSHVPSTAAHKPTHVGLTGVTLSASMHGRSKEAGSSIPPVPPLPTNHTFGPQERVMKRSDFETIKNIGRGGFATVNLVRDRITKNYFALKTLEKDSMCVALMGKIFEEQRIGRQVADSPWLLGVEGSFEDADHFYLLTEFAAGGDLHHRLKRAPLSPHATMSVMAELVAALEELHERRIIHLDLKGENILIDWTGHILLADFGLSRAFGVSAEERPWEETKAWSRCSIERHQDQLKHLGHDVTVLNAGTPGFMSPEVWLKQPYSYEADIFSLGVVFYQTLTGVLPFGITSRMSLAEFGERTLNAPLHFPVGFDSRATNLISGMLDRNPHNRPTISQIKSHPFFRKCRWDIIARRDYNPSIQRELFMGQLPQDITPDPSIRPASTISSDHVVYPWFAYTGPAFTERRPMLRRTSVRPLLAARGRNASLGRKKTTARASRSTQHMPRKTVH